MTQAEWDKACEWRFGWWVRVGETVMTKKRHILGGLTRSAVVGEVDRIFPPPDFTVVTRLDQVTNKMTVEVRTAPPYATKEELELAEIYLKYLITCEAEEEEMSVKVLRSPDPSVQALLRKRLQN
jgi:hypothetical protein